MIYDVIIIGAGASGLFAGMNLDKKLNKLILEKTTKPGAKVLLSGGERANVSNMNIDLEKDYFSQNKKFLFSVFSKFNQWDTMSYFSNLGINIVEEDRGRLILESGNSRELLEIFLKRIENNHCKIDYNQDVKDIKKLEDGNFEIITDLKQKYYSKNVIVSSGGKSFFQVGTTGEGYSIAEKLGLKIVNPYRGLCGLSTKKDLSFLSGISCEVILELIDNGVINASAFQAEKGIINPSAFQAPSLKPKGREKGLVYKEKGPILFTHFGLSGPIIFNTSIAIGEYLNSIGINLDDYEKYMLEKLSISLEFDINNIPKKVVKFFDLIFYLPQHSKQPSPQPSPLEERGNKVKLDLQNWRSWKEAKVTGGGIDLDELDNNLQSKKYTGLYFIGELVDVTGKTGGYNLQWAWSSGYVVSKFINEKN